MATAALAGVAVLGALLGPAGRLDPPISEGVALTAGFVPVGLFLVRHRPESRTARLTWVVGMLALTGVAAAAWSGTLGGAWLTQWTWWPPLALLPVLLLGFPDGSPGRPTTALSRALLVCCAASTALLAAAAALAPRTLLTDADAVVPPACRPLLVGVGVLATATVLGLLVALVVLLVRARRERGATRSQVLCLAPAALLVPVGVGLDIVDVPYALVPAVLALPLGIGAAILQHRFDDLDQVVHRGSVRGILTVAVVLGYAGVLLLVQRASSGTGPQVVAVLTLAVAAVLLDPVRRRAQAGVERLLYGHRDEPYAVLSDLGLRLATVGPPAQMLETTTLAIVESLRVPASRVAVRVDDADVVVAECGHADTDPVEFTLEQGGRRVGTLTVWTRRRGEGLTREETRLLAEVARQAGVAARAHQLTLDLQTARQHLVLAREEERLRLRRDFHDGIGPLIAGARMQLHATLPALPDGSARHTVDLVAADLGDLARSVREIVDSLRPAALDLGLEAALTKAAGAVLADREVVLETTGRLEDLPPAVEVAAYRIITEALHNVARHSGATRCVVRLDRGRDLRITVRDNGSGIAATTRGGVGTASMTARAEELGGRLTRTTGPAGTSVEAILPVAAHAPEPNVPGVTAGADGTSSR